VRDVRTMGQEGKHARFSLHSGAHRALGVAFGRSSLGVGEEDAVDAAVRLEVNRWNGSVEPRVVLRELYPVERFCECPDEQWWGRFECELRLPLDPAPQGDDAEGRAREVVRGGGSVASTVAELVSSGAEALVVCADAARRPGLAALSRFGSPAPQGVCGRCGGSVVGGPRAPAVTDYMALERSPSLAGEFVHVVLVDPPTSTLQESLASCPVDGWSEAGAHPGYLHEAYDRNGASAALAALEEQLARRPALIGLYRDLRDAGEVGGEDLLYALRGNGAQPRGPEAAARCFRVLADLELVRGEPQEGNGTVGVVSSESTDLECSAAFRAYGDRHQEALRYLERRNRTRST